MMPTKFKAVLKLVGGEISQLGNGEFLFRSGQKPPTEEAIQAKLVELQTEYDSKQYQRDRELEYPSIQELVVALYDADDKAEIDKKRAEIKKKYPKPE